LDFVSNSLTVIRNFELDACWIVHQFALSSRGMKDFLLNASQSNIISANKEGLLSLLGITCYSCKMCIL
jgi:hypothetical protein